MGWNWRRVLNFGPVRVNFSKNGIGYSIGAKGVRIGRNVKRENYTQLTVPKTGIYYRTILSKASGSPTKIGIVAVVAIFIALLFLKLAFR
jgi:hypothetical protein